MTDIIEIEDVGEAVRAGRALRSARNYRIQIAQGDLSFKNLHVTDPVPLGRQILTSAGLDPDGDFSLFAILPNGDFEDVRLDETFDLRGREVERFIVFQTDRTFKLTVKNHQVEWGKPSIAGSVLYELAKPGQGEAVFLEVRGGQDRLIETEEQVDLTASGVERFIVGPKPKTNYVITVNGRERTVEDEHVTYEQVVQLAFPGPRPANMTYSCTYTHAASKPSSGPLSAGGVVTVKKEGTIFNVTGTVQS